MLRKFNALALARGRTSWCQETGFVQTGPRISVYENFCFARALLQSKEVDSILQGRALIQRLEAFRTEEGFPSYLHEYPHVRDKTLLMRIAHLENPPPLAPISWNPCLGLPSGPLDQALQDGYEPEMTLSDFFMAAAYSVFPKRLEKSHPVHLELPLIQTFPALQAEGIPWQIQRGQGGHFRMAWGDLSRVHTLVSHGSGVTLAWEDSSLLIRFLEGTASFALYWDYTPDSSCFVNGKRATLFYLGDRLTLQWPQGASEWSFEPVEGEGRILGHLSRGNRPGNRAVSPEGVYPAYDWKLSLEGGFSGTLSAFFHFNLSS